jgi:putative membrane protein
MMRWWDGWSWWAWPVMTLGMVAFWVAVAWIVVAAFRRSQDVSVHGGPEEILAERFARGEIDEAEYERRRAALRSSV